MEKHGALLLLVDCRCGHSACAETAAALSTVLQVSTGLQELPSAAESRVSLAWPTQLLPSCAPSSDRAPLSLSRALPRRHTRHNSTRSSTPE